jgi:hypothetical protein
METWEVIKRILDANQFALNTQLTPGQVITLPAPQ